MSRPMRSVSEPAKLATPAKSAKLAKLVKLATPAKSAKSAKLESSVAGEAT